MVTNIAWFTVFKGEKQMKYEDICLIMGLLMFRKGESLREQPICQISILKLKYLIVVFYYTIKNSRQINEIFNKYKHKLFLDLYLCIKENSELCHQLNMH
jgi:hypothetical protein